MAMAGRISVRADPSKGPIFACNHYYLKRKGWFVGSSTEPEFKVGDLVWLPGGPGAPIQVRVRDVRFGLIPEMPDDWGYELAAGDDLSYNVPEQVVFATKDAARAADVMWQIER